MRMRVLNFELQQVIFTVHFDPLLTRGRRKYGSKCFASSTTCSKAQSMISILRLTCLQLAAS